MAARYNGVMRIRLRYIGLFLGGAIAFLRPADTHVWINGDGFIDKAVFTIGGLILGMVAEWWLAAYPVARTGDVSEVEEIEERLGDLWSMTSAESDYLFWWTSWIATGVLLFAGFTWLAVVLLS